jgi:hypothetical protein
VHVFVPTFQWHGYSDINMFVDDATLKNARRSAEVAIHHYVFTAKMAAYGDHLPLKNARASYPISL